MATDRLGGDRVPDVDVARRLFNHPEGGQMVEAAADMTKRDSLREAAREALRAEFGESVGAGKPEAFLSRRVIRQNLDRKSTRLNSSHVKISYAVFCLKKKRSTDNIN